MSDLVKAAGLIGAALCASVFGAIGEMEMCYSFGGIFTLLLTGQPIKTGIGKLVK